MVIMDTLKYKNLFTFIGKYVDFDINELAEAIPFINILNLHKNEILINEGEIANCIAFTNKGYLRVYFNYNGEEITRDITPLHTFATALPSFISQAPSYEIISAITSSELFIIKKSDLDYLYSKYPKWERLGRRIIEDMFVEVQRRLYLFITESAEVRYKQFVKRYPDIMHDVPLKYIADFIGVKLQSLSRLRKTVEW
jgi:CRP-like cAMP-binding protein